MPLGGFVSKLKIQMLVFYQCNEIMLKFGLDFVKHFVLDKVVLFTKMVSN